MDNTCRSGTPIDCDDGVTCTADSCDESSDSCSHAPSNAVCDDGLYCNGAETCDVDFGCQTGTAIDCDDDVTCTVDSCDESSDSCSHAPSNAVCDDGLYCNGAETCDVDFGCQVGTPIDCDDGVACTADSCDESSDSCSHAPSNAGCDDGLYCNGAETCDADLGCQMGVLPCGAQLCDDLDDACVECLADGDCDDSSFCNGAETCVDHACESGVAPCDGLTCDELLDACVDLPAVPLPIQPGDTWMYLKGVAEPSFGWNGLVQTDDLWAAGPSGLGYSDGDDATVLTDMPDNYLSVYMRISFEPGDVSAISRLTLTVDYDDGFVAYINGTEVARSPSMIGQGDPPAFDTPANTPDHEAGTPEVYDISQAITQLVDGVNVLAIQVHNRSLSSSDLSLIPELTADYGCTSADDCDDGSFCNGPETCDTNTGSCLAGAAPCAAPQCDEDLDTCSEEFVCPAFAPGVQVGTLKGGSDAEADVNESSGLVVSRHNDGILWTHNDDTNDNRLFALSTDGTVRAVFTVGSGARDPEDIAIGPGPVPGIDYLYWGDIGDNGSGRSTVFVKRVPEPVVHADQAPATGTLADVEVITLSYPSGADAPSHKDSETLLVDPLSGDIFLVTKRTSPNRVYVAPYPQSTTSTTTMTFVTDIAVNAQSTGGEISADGSLIVVRKYTGSNPDIYIWHRGPGVSVGEAMAAPPCAYDMLNWERQGEAIGWNPDGGGFYTVSEDESAGAQIPIWYYEVD